tara:strand:- start:178 stop:408 length:231 start_codon:yes stop_codon:yes gene_type:complete
MRIGVLVGKKADGSLEYIGKPGDIAALDAKQQALTDSADYVKTWLADASQNPLKDKKCVGATPAKAAKKKKAAKKD